MKKVIEKLLVLQEIDGGALELKARMDEIPRQLGERQAELDSHRERAEAAEHRTKEARRAFDSKNAQVEEFSRKMQNLSLKQNTARTNKEYEAFKTEIAGLKADRDIVEEEALLQLTVQEEREAEAARERKLVARLEVEVAEFEKQCSAELEELEERMAVIAADRAGKTHGIPPSWLDRYERLLETIGVPVLVPIVEQYCEGCQINLSIHDVTRAFNAAEVVQCRSCNRILYAETL